MPKKSPAPGPAPAALGRSTKELAQDDLVMSTNSSSIVSKRSVERIYYPDEPHFFRFFVKKFQRRSPLVNRGYHFRLHIIDVSVRNFLRRPSGKKKVIVNLGAGSDVLPWQCMTRYPEACHGAKFVDIDFPDLIAKKRRIVQETPELHSVLTDLEYGNGQSDLQLTSNEYVQIGCDLRQLDRLQDALSQVVDIPECEFIFIAEVSITYMETEAADSVIQWASTLGHAEFCLLEQILPDGPDHPFADMMVRHFHKMRAPIKSVNQYPTLQAQQARFQRLGWVHADAQSLWGAWSSERYLTPAERRKMDRIEPFDEWEEFAIFVSHYCIVSAHTRPDVLPPCRDRTGEEDQQGEGGSMVPSFQVSTTFTECGKVCQRRFGAPMKVPDQFGREFLGNACGLGNVSRLRSIDLFTSDPQDAEMDVLSAGPSSRMCHSMVDLGVHGQLLAGGRASPSSAFRDCWRFDGTTRLWQKAADLPQPLFRHSAARLGRSSLALVVGGKTDSTSVFKSCLLYQPDAGWTECNVSGTDYVPVFGAVLVSYPDPISPESEDGEPTVGFHGLLIGGVLEDGTLAEQALYWRLSIRGADKPELRFEAVSTVDDSGRAQPNAKWPDESTLYRFGASAVMGDDGNLLVIGGIIKDRVIPRDEELLLLSAKNSKIRISATAPIIQPGATSSQTDIPRPALLGISVSTTATGDIVVMSGGATCYSFGTYWNSGTYSLRYNLPGAPNPPQNQAPVPWRFQKSVEFTEAAADLENAAVQVSPPDE
ncbi:LCM-domain-containing protein [Apiospora saccharicola]|uniref:tRNA wybutosine-synthesizing protein 4 n=1 Tax=Apiospora saccharicola TaxID=335842 RepID=A0ABR1W8C0_9PEZI